ncbi:MAG: CPBP family intramembrane glutamic endopeptidase [Chlorobiaceae bacterium]
MQTFSFSDAFEVRRLSFFANTFFLIGIMVLYPIAGALLFFLVNGNWGFSLLHIESRMLPSMRFIQACGQIVVLALPVLLLAARHTRRKNPFCTESLAFLGIGRNFNVAAAGLAAGGVFLLQPLLYTISAVQDLYLWPALGNAGAEVVRQRDVMEAFIRQLALVRSGPEFFAVAAVFAVIPAVCEELLFRGYIQENYSRSMSRGSAVLLTGFVFAFFHLSAANLFPLTLLGWYIGYIYSETGELALSFFVHLVNNSAALILLMLAETSDLAALVQPECLLRAVWWWPVVGGSLLLFVMVMRRFSVAIKKVGDLG